ncbi:MAG: hypothetical protein V1494_05300 [Candidatus Diapherotrites archaeon]
MKAFKKHLLAMGLIVLLASIANAATINAPQKLPSGANWSFSIALDATDSFEKTVVLLDGSEIATVYANGQVTKSGALVLDAFTFDSEPASNSGLTLYVSGMGLSTGSHSVNAKTYNSGELKQEDSASIEVFEPMASSEKDSLEQRISGAEANIEELRTSITSTNVDNGVLMDRMNQRNEDVDYLQGKVQELEAMLSTASTDLSALKAESDKAKEEEMLKQQAEMQAQNSGSGESEGLVTTGLFVLRKNSNFLIALAFVVAAAMVGLFFWNKRKKSIYDGPID